MKSFSLSAIVNKRGHNAGAGCLDEEEGLLLIGNSHAEWI